MSLVGVDDVIGNGVLHILIVISISHDVIDDGAYSCHSGHQL